MANKILTFLIVVAFCGGYILGLGGKHSTTKSEKELQKDIIFKQHRIDSLKGFIDQLKHQISRTDQTIADRDTSTKKIIQHETGIIPHFDNAPYIKLDSFLRARYPDSTTVARRSYR